MPIDPTGLRQLSTVSNANVVFAQQDGATTATTEQSRFDGGRFFRSSETSTRNKAQFQTLLTQLRQDPNIGKSESAVQAAFAAISKQAASGEPLSTRLLARAIDAGDKHMAQLAAMKAEAGRQLFSYGASQLANAATFDKLVNTCSGGSLPGFGELPAGLREAMRAEVLNTLRGLIEARDLNLEDLRPKDMHRLLEDAMTLSIPKLDSMADSQRTTPWQDAPRLMQRLSPALSAALDSVHTFSQMRMNARLCASSGEAEYAAARYDEIASRQIAAMDNKALLGLMRTLQSTDAIAFRLSLAQAASQPGNLRAQDMLEALNAFEGHVLDAFTSRIGDVGPQDGMPARDLTPGQLTALGSQVGKDFKASLNEQSDAFLAGKAGAPRQLVEPGGARHVQGHGIDPLALKKMVQAAPLTLNFNSTIFEPATQLKDGSYTHTFIRPDGEVDAEALKMKNIFELPSNVKGEDYLARRDAVERHQYPEMARREDALGFSPQDRPLYAGVNVGREQLGAASGYGTCFFVLKDEVKQRALYAPTDTFYSHSWAIDDDRAQAFKTEVVSMLADSDSGLSTGLRDAIKRNPELLGDLTDKLDEAVRSGASGAGRGNHTIEKWVEKNLNQLVGGGETLKLSVDDQGFLQAAAMRIFMDPEVQGASLEHVDRVFRHLNQDQLTTVASLGDDPLAINAGLQEYIEAQVFGGVDLNQDVAEVHMLASSKEEDMFPFDKEVLANARRVAEQIGAKFVLVLAEQGPSALPKTLDPTSEEGQARLEAARRERELPLTRIDGRFPSEAVRDNPAVKATREGGLAAFKQGPLAEMLNIYSGHEQTFDPEGIHGRQHIGRVLIYANVLANFFAEAGVEVDRHALYTTCALHDSGREGNGVDRWEGESAEQALNALREQGITEPDYLELAKGCIQGDSTDRHSLEALILKSADSLDILRVKGVEGFDTRYLAFMRGDLELGPGQRIQQDTVVRDALIGEIASFIEATSYHPPSEAAWLRARAEMDAILIEQAELGPKVTDQSLDCQRRLTEKQAEVRTLRDRSMQEHRDHGLQTDGIAQFEAMERELRDHPEKYPLLNKYYDPGK